MDHCEHLTFGVTQGGGFVQLTGEVGTGKTTICRCMLTQLPESIDVALITNPRISELELLATLCDELRIDYPEPATSKILLDRLNQRLLSSHAAGRRTVLIIDEAQNLSRQVLERVRLLTNLETAKEKLLQIILIGQPELAETLDRPDLRQLAQRITARYSLVPLSQKETGEYIAHRLAVAGCTRKVFSRGAIRKIYKRSKGVPRIINVVCDRALLGAYASNVSEVDGATVKQAIYELYGDETSSTGMPWLRYAAMGVGALAVAGLAGWMLGAGGFSKLKNTPPTVADAAQTTATGAEKAAAGLTNTESETDTKSDTETALVATAQDTKVESEEPASAEGAPVPPGMMELKPEAPTTLSSANTESNDTTVAEPANEAAPVDSAQVSGDEVKVTPSANEETSAAQAPEISETASTNTVVAAVDDTVPDAQPEPTESVSAASTATESPDSGSPGDEILRTVAETGEESRLPNALGRLAGLWGVNLDTSGGSLCDDAESVGLKCVNANGNWNNLRRFDRPVLLRLETDSADDQRYVVVRNLDDDHAQVVVGGRGMTYPLDAIESVWSGDFVMLWRPAVSKTPLQTGASGEDVLWLRRALNFVALNNSGVDTGDIENEVFDDTLRSRVEQFQQTNEIKERGVVGAETLIALNSLVQSGMPRLTRF